MKVGLMIGTIFLKVLIKLGRCKNEYIPLKVSGAELHCILQMSNLTRIQPHVVSSRQLTIMGCYFAFHAVSNGTTWKRINIFTPER